MDVKSGVSAALGFQRGNCIAEYGNLGAKAFNLDRMRIRKVVPGA